MLRSSTVTSPEDENYQWLRDPGGALLPGGTYVALNGFATDWLRFGLPCIDSVVLSLRRDAADLAALAALVDAGDVRPRVALARPLSDATAREAFGVLKTRRAAGKLTLTLEDAPWTED